MGSRPPELGQFVGALGCALDAAGFPFMLVGGQAVLVHGRPRLTEDVDVTLGADPGRLPDLLSVCDAVGLRPLPSDVAQFVGETFVLPARHAETALRVDFIFSATPYERQAIGRAERVPIGDTHVPVATAEDLILHKLFAGRPRDLEDAESVVRRRGDVLDWGYLARWAGEFAAVPGREGMPAQVERLRKRP